MQALGTPGLQGVPFCLCFLSKCGRQCATQLHAHAAHPPFNLRLCAALKERIGRLLAAVLPVATSGREARSSSAGGFARSTTISIRSRPSEQQEAPAAADGKKKGEGGRGVGARWDRVGHDRTSLLSCAPFMVDLWPHPSLSWAICPLRAPACYSPLWSTCSPHCG